MSPPSQAARLAVWIPLGAALVAHVAAVTGGFTNWDDPLYLLNNSLTVDPLRNGVLHLLTTPNIDYAIPVTVLGYAGQRAAFGLNPMYFHLVSLAIHLGAVALVMSLCRRVGLGRWAAVAAASLFAVHPLTVEPVAWVVGQKDLWAALFLLAAMRVRASDESWPRSLACIGLCVLAIGSKPSAVAAPLLIVAIDWTLGRRLTEPRRLLLYAVLAVVAIAATWIAIAGHSDLQRPASFGIATVANAGWAATLQLRHVFAPSGLSANYFAPDGWVFTALCILGIGLGVGLVALIVALYRHGQRIAAGSLAAALIAYAPVSGIVQISRGPADSYLYLPLALLAPAAGLAAAALWSRGRRPLRGMLIALLVLFALVSAARTQVWRGAEPLWLDVVDTYPDEPLAHHRFANALQWGGKMQDALEVFEGIRERWPDHVASVVDHGFTLDALGRQADAETLFALGARLGDNPYYREYYGSYLLGHPRLEPSDRNSAERAIAEMTPALIKGRAPVPILLRAAHLLEPGGNHADMVARLFDAAQRR